MAGQKQVGRCVAVVYPIMRGSETRLTLYEWSEEKARGEAVRKWRQLGLRKPGYGLALYVRGEDDTHRLTQAKHGYSRGWDDAHPEGLAKVLPPSGTPVFSREEKARRRAEEGGGPHFAVIYNTDSREVARFRLRLRDSTLARQQALHHLEDMGVAIGRGVAVYEEDAEKGGPPVLAYYREGLSRIWELEPRPGLALVLPDSNVSAYLAPNECRAMRASRIEEGRRRLLGRFGENACVTLE